MNFLILLFQAIQEAIKALQGLLCFYILFLTHCFTEPSQQPTISSFGVTVWYVNGIGRSLT